MRTKELFSFIKERHAIYTRRKAGQAKPWTADPILRQYRFCNVYRELDKVTMWIAENWRNPHSAEKDVWFALLVSRFVNLPDTLTELGYPIPWDPVRFVKVIESRKERKLPAFTSAYMIHAGPQPGLTKSMYLAQWVFNPIWQTRKTFGDVAFAKGVSLNTISELFRDFRDMGPFMTGQVIADMKYLPCLRKAPDWDSFAIQGPGSERGLSRVLSRPFKPQWKSADWLSNLHLLKVEIDPMIKQAGLPALHAQDLQNCLCEFDKYERVRLGEGRPRNLYKGV